MAVDVVLKNASGQPVTYPGVEKVVLDTLDGGTAEFSLGSGGSPGYLVREGDTLEKLYFNTGFDLGSSGASFEIPVLVSQKDESNKFELVWKYEHLPLDSYHNVYARITQGGVETRVDLFLSFGGWIQSELDLSGYDIGTVTSTLLDPSQTPLFTKEKMSFGLFPGLPQYLVAPQDMVSGLFFNPMSAEAVSFMLPELFQMTHKDSDTDPDFGFSYGEIGLDLRVADLSSIGLGEGYVLYSYNVTGPYLIFSTVTFDASAFLPGFKVEKTGWQQESIQYKTPVVADYGKIPWIIGITGYMHMVWAKVPFSIDLSGIF